MWPSRRTARTSSIAAMAGCWFARWTKSSRRLLPAWAPCAAVSFSPTANGSASSTRTRAQEGGHHRRPGRYHLPPRWQPRVAPPGDLTARSSSPRSNPRHRTVPSLGGRRGAGGTDAAQPRARRDRPFGRNCCRAARRSCSRFDAGRDRQRAGGRARSAHRRAEDLSCAAGATHTTSRAAPALGHLVYAAAGTLRAVPFDLETPGNGGHAGSGCPAGLDHESRARPTSMWPATARWCTCPGDLRLRHVRWSGSTVRAMKSRLRPRPVRTRIRASRRMGRGSR